MNYRELFTSFARTDDTPTRAVLIGAGQFGRALIAQARRIALLDLVGLCDLDVDRCISDCVAAGYDKGDIAVCGSAAEARSKQDAGKLVVTDDPQVVIGMDCDVMVEATGNAEAGATNCVGAIEQGRHIVLVNKETDSVVGPILSQRARAAGLTLSQVDGDQPSLLLGLISWAETLGMRVVSAGKASEHDFVYDEGRGVVFVEGQGQDIRLPGGLFHRSDQALADLVAERASVLSDLPQRTPPDYCEMCLVANGSGLKPDRPDLHAPIARTIELPDLFRSRVQGGILETENTLDIFNCYRRSDEISFAGGVFAVLETPDPATGVLFRAKGIPVSADCRNVLVYNPTHLLGSEAPVSILASHRLGMATGSANVRPVCDVVMQATRGLPAGTVLEGRGTHHRIEGVAARLVDYQPLSSDTPVPYFLGIDRTLARPVNAGEAIACGSLQPLDRSLLYDLRVQQDRL